MGELGRSLSEYWYRVQETLFPMLEEELGPLTEKQQQLVTILEVVRVEQHLPWTFGCCGRPPKNRAAIARSFVAKMVYNMDTTSALWERLQMDKGLRRLCGWENKKQIPSEATFSRAFAEFAESELPQRVHKALIEKTYGETQTIVLHNSRDSTAIVARERPAPKCSDSVTDGEEERIRKGPGRPKKGEERPSKEPRRVEKQLTMSLEEMLHDLPKACDIGAKRNSKGHSEHWVGYKLHTDVADGGIPISSILTSASVHDSQVAIPLGTMTARRVTNLYDLMDAAYDSPEILAHSKSLGHVPIVPRNPRRNKELAQELANEAKRQKAINWTPPEKIRYKERTTAERVHARLKDEFGGRVVRVRGSIKVMCHLMFGILALTADQLMQLVR